MRAVERAEAIVLALRDSQAMVKEDARAFLAEHDAGVRVDALAEGAGLLLRQAARKLRRPQHNAGLRQGAGILLRAADRPATEVEADFFQRDHTYADGSIWRFRCDTVTTHPDGGELCALGWVLFNGQWQEASYTVDDWEMGKAIGWVDVTGEVTP